MKVILLKDVRDLGRRWDICDVSAGYARNVLIPQGLAVPATAEQIKRALAEQKKAEERAEENLRKIQELASAIDGLELTIPARANAQGELYAGVSARHVSEALGREGYRVPQKAIRLTEPLKQLGEYPLTITLDHGLEVQIRVIIEPLEEPEILDEKLSR